MAAYPLFAASGSPLLWHASRFLRDAGPMESHVSQALEHAPGHLPTTAAGAGSSVHDRRFRFVRQLNLTVGAYFGSWGAVTTFAAAVTAEIVGALNPHSPRSPSASINRAHRTEGRLLLIP